MPVARWMFADAGLANGVVARRVARMNPLRWSSCKSLDGTVAELGRCRPEQWPRPVRLELSRGGEGEGCEALAFESVEAAIAELKQRRAGGRREAEQAEARSLSHGSSESRKVALSFRCEDRSKIPDALLEGPFQTLEIAEDVYSTAYVIARNATEEMYSIWPWVNSQVQIVWLYLLFIVGSQLFVITVITFIYPLSVETESALVDCLNATSLADAQARGFRDAIDSARCRIAGKLLFRTDLHGSPVEYHNLVMATPFYESVLMEGSFVVNLLRFVCCTWVFTQTYFQHFVNVKSLIEYHDFGLWFLPLKGMEARNRWAVHIAFIQYGVVIVVLTVSFVSISAQRDPFDIVMNSLAFTFIAEVGTFFNRPLVQRMASRSIHGLSEGWGEMFYLYPEYLESNAINDDGTYTDEGWYILEDEEKAGLLSDYKVKHNPAAYPHPSESLISALSWAIVAVPVLVTLLFAARSRWGLHGVASEPRQAEL